MSEGRTGLDEGKESGIEKAGFYYLIGDSHPDVCVFKTGLPNWGLASHRFPDRNTLEIELLLFCSQFTLGSSAPYNPPPHIWQFYAVKICLPRIYSLAAQCGSLCTWPISVPSQTAPI